MYDVRFSSLLVGEVYRGCLKIEERGVGRGRGRDRNMGCWVGVGYTGRGGWWGLCCHCCHCLSGVYGSMGQVNSGRK